MLAQCLFIFHGNGFLSLIFLGLTTVWIQVILVHNLIGVWSTIKKWLPGFWNVLGAWFSLLSTKYKNICGSLLHSDLLMIITQTFICRSLVHPLGQTMSLCLGNGTHKTIFLGSNILLTLSSNRGISSCWTGGVICIWSQVTWLHSMPLLSIGITTSLISLFWRTRSSKLLTESPTLIWTKKIIKIWSFRTILHLHWLEQEHLRKKSSMTRPMKSLQAWIVVSSPWLYFCLMHFHGVVVLLSPIYYGGSSFIFPEPWLSWSVLSSSLIPKGTFDPSSYFFLCVWWNLWLCIEIDSLDF